MKKLILTVMLAFGLVAGAQAAGGEGLAWDKAPSRTNDLPALQNGAKLFVNYCLNCHSAAFMRFNRLQDIGISEQQIKDNLLTVSAKVGDNMVAPLDPKEAKEWFGGVPPDLTLIARSRAGRHAERQHHGEDQFFHSASSACQCAKVMRWGTGLNSPMRLHHGISRKKPR